MQTKMLALGLAFLGCATTAQTTPPTNKTTEEQPMGDAWLKDNPLTLCPISGGVPSETSGSGMSDSVTNGSAFDCYGFSFGGVSTIELPEGGEVEESAEAGTIIVKTNKTLSFKGHPPKPMSPETARNNMGVAYQLNGDTLTLATYGEFSTKEGGASIKLVILVPPKSKLKRNAKLSGPNSTAATREYPDSEKDYWYTGNKPGASWIALKAVPDPGSR